MNNKLKESFQRREKPLGIFCGPSRFSSSPPKAKNHPFGWFCFWKPIVNVKVNSN